MDRKQEEAMGLHDREKIFRAAIIRETLIETGGNCVHAAARLKITRSDLYRLLRVLGIDLAAIRARRPQPMET